MVPQLHCPITPAQTLAPLSRDILASSLYSGSGDVTHLYTCQCGLSLCTGPAQPNPVLGDVSVQRWSVMLDVNG